MNSESRQTGPLQDLFLGIKRILEFMEVKDMNAASEGETAEAKDMADMWLNAKYGYDTYTTYHRYWTISMFQEVQANAKLKYIRHWMEHPFNVPVDFRENLLIRGREAFMNSYEEQNDYYRMLYGLPPLNTPASEFIYMSEPTRNELSASNEPIHLLSPLIQNNFMATEEYQQLLVDHPDKKYLRYLGMYKIDFYAARKAKDFEIIRYPSSRSDINPNLLSEFNRLYDNYREYVMSALYNKQMEGLFTNYRTFMGLLIKMFVLMQINNRAVASINSRDFLDDSILHTILSMYDIPNTLMLTNDVRRSLAINLLQLTREKGTNEVYYDLVRILGYQDIVVSKLMLMKGQQFDKDSNYAVTGVEPYFVQVDLKDQNPYETITSGKAPMYGYHEITDPDPTWWDLPDTRKILEESNYTASDSKYITVEATIHQIKYLFESIYFTRMILDNQQATDQFMIEIPEIFGTQMVSIYDLMVYIVAATCMSNGLTGEIISETEQFMATAGFNFDIDLDAFVEFLNTTKYVDKDRLMSFMENLTIKTQADINRLFNDVLYPMREWLESKIAAAENKYEYVEYESIYRALYTYDAARNSFLEDFRMPIDIIATNRGVSKEDMMAFQHFYPRTMDGQAITVDTYSDSRYKNPFLSRTNIVDWWIHVVIDTPYGEDDRGYVYFHDILNCDDLRELTNPDGTRVFMDYEDGEVGWEINQKAVERALYLLDHLDDDALHNAKFQVMTPVANGKGKRYAEGEPLPAIIRSGTYKDILKDKLQMDMAGLAVPPTTYHEYLYRKNRRLYDLLMDGNRFELNQESWMNDVMRIVLAVEAALDLHMKYFEQSVVGSELFFKPLITLIKHFKSSLVDIAKTGLRYVFGDKIDAGGNSNMFKLFDEVKFVVHFVTLANRGFESQFGLYDTEHRVKYHITMKDRSHILQMALNRFIVNQRQSSMGSIHMTDEMKFFLNGKDIDPGGFPSMWFSGEPGTGRWEQEDRVIMRDRKGIAVIDGVPVDMEGWKDFVQSYVPVE